MTTASPQEPRYQLTNQNLLRMIETEFGKSKEAFLAHVKGQICQQGEAMMAQRRHYEIDFKTNWSAYISFEIQAGEKQRANSLY